MNSAALNLVPMLRVLVPGTATLLLVVFAATPIGVPFLSAVSPLLTLGAVYFWGIYRPETLPVWVAFVLGLVQDLLTGAPLGLTALILVLARELAVSQRRVVLGQSFGVEWAGFVLVAVGASGVAWAGASIYAGSLVRPDPLVVQGLLTAAAYPALWWLLAQAARFAPGPRPTLAP